MQSTLKRMFEKELAHGKDIYNVTTGKTVRVVIRENSDRNKIDERSTIMYPQDDSIRQGDEVVYKGTHYLVLNRDARESDVYYKSDLRALTVDAKFYATDSEKLYFSKAYVSDMTSASINDQTYVDTIRAAISVTMSNNDAAKAVGIDSYIAMWGCKYKISHIIRKNNMCFIYAQYSAADQEISTISCSTNLSSDAKYIVGDKVNVDVVLIMSTDSQSYIVDSADCLLQFSSSNENVAEFNGTELTFTGAGTTDITIAYEYEGLSGSTTITISVSASDSYLINYSDDCDGVIFINYDCNIEAKLYKGSNEIELPVGATVEWTHQYSGSASREEKYVTYTPNGLMFTVYVSSGSSATLGDSIDFACNIYNADGTLFVAGDSIHYEIEKM